MKTIREVCSSQTWQPFFEDIEIVDKDNRNNYTVITGSLISSILGINPYTTPFQAWNKIVNGVPIPTTTYGEKKMKAGSKLEKIILEYFAEEFAPDELLYFSDYSEFFISKIYPFIGGKPDAICIKNNTPYMIEIKNMGFETAKTFIEGEVPLNYLIQAQIYAWLFKVPKILYPIFIDGYDFRIFGPFDRDDNFVENIIRQVRIFKEKFVDTKQPPEPQTYEEVVLSFPVAKSGHSKKVNDEIRKLLDKYSEIKKQKKELEDEEERIKFEIANFLEDSEFLYDGDILRATFKNVTSNHFDTKSFQKLYPELYTQFLKKNSTRRLVIKTTSEEL